MPSVKCRRCPVLAVRANVFERPHGFRGTISGSFGSIYSMFSFQQLARLTRGASRLKLSATDTCRWLWSYYRSRLPGGASGSPSCVDIDVKIAGRSPLRVRIRNNGFDYDVVEEVLGRGVYSVEASDVRRVLDLGANIGIASLYFATRYPGAEVCAVEPSTLNQVVLEHNVKANNVPVRVVRGAVGEKDGRARFVISGDPRQDFCEATGRAVTGQGTRIEVDQYSVPSLMRLMGWEEIDLLKIDIEGGEVSVLGGRPEWLRKVGAIVGEGHEGVGYSIEACRRDLEPMGFEVQLLEKREGAAMVFFARRVTTYRKSQTA